VLIGGVGIGAMLGALGLAAEGARLARVRVLLEAAPSFGVLLVLVRGSCAPSGVALALLALAGCAMIVTRACQYHAADPR